jgi:hypothetical protein
MCVVRVLLLAFAVILTAEPVVHNHPLLSGTEASGTSVCAICATAVGRLPMAAPAIAAPQIVVHNITAPILIEVAIVTPSSRASRAPPAA